MMVGHFILIPKVSNLNQKMLKFLKQKRCLVPEGLFSLKKLQNAHQLTYFFKILMQANQVSKFILRNLA
ncbi:UNKNOWN [Stylonychia lemnae]|uniref:Uncharacterized protein n=1 Tax=Stylonychia lemnae TaxID=5949 RepID=A0A078BAD3_STYLE|nr:UNKNOWN [Stylonychia lemnae]|eukprot:CDW90478.1 UNKNOWN [Stylonychia lemnae]